MCCRHKAGAVSNKSCPKSTSQNGHLRRLLIESARVGHLLGYAWVSTADQKPELQLDGLKAIGCYRVFVDKASGALDERPQLLKVLDQLRLGDTLVVWKLDRLGRSQRHLIDTIAELHGRDVGFRSLQESIDTTTPGGKLIFHIFGALAEFERDLVRERTLAGRPKLVLQNVSAAAARTDGVSLHPYRSLRASP